MKGRSILLCLGLSLFLHVHSFTTTARFHHAIQNGPSFAKPVDFTPRKLGSLSMSSENLNEAENLNVQAATSPVRPTNNDLITAKAWLGSPDAAKIINAVLVFGFIGIALYNVANVNADYARGWTLEEYIFRIPGSNLLRYESMVGERPIFTKALTSMFAYGVGDFTTQIIQGKTLKDTDLVRTGRSAAAGFIGHGPLCHFWLEFMEQYLSFGGAWWAVFVKVFADQTAWSLYLNASYCTIQSALQGRSPGRIWGEIKKTAWPALSSGWRFWPFVHMISYGGFIPVTLRLLFIDVMEVAWVVILSKVVNDDSHGGGGDSTEEEKVLDPELSLANVAAVEEVGVPAMQKS